jgi:hypothetical protein
VSSDPESVLVNREGWKMLLTKSDLENSNLQNPNLQTVGNITSKEKS